MHGRERFLPARRVRCAAVQAQAVFESFAAMRYGLMAVGKTQFGVSRYTWSLWRLRKIHDSRFPWHDGCLLHSNNAFWQLTFL